MKLKSAVVKATGSYYPERVLTNSDFEKFLDTSDEWIITRTGIKERRIVAPGETNSDMSSKAARQALERAGVSPEDVELIVVATVTPDMLYPPASCLIQAKIGSPKATCFDVSCACTSYVVALGVASSMVKSGAFGNALVIGSDIMTSIADYTDRNTCILFGDAASCLYLEASDVPGRGVLDYKIGADGTLAELITQPGGGSLHPSSLISVTSHQHYVRMNGQEVFKRAVRIMAESAEELMRRNSITSDELAYFIPHQANGRIIASTAQRMGIPPERVLVNIDRFGNTTSASIPLCVDELASAGKLRDGDKLILTAVGAGLTWGSVYLVWGT